VERDGRWSLGLVRIACLRNPVVPLPLRVKTTWIFLEIVLRIFEFAGPCATTSASPSEALAIIRPQKLSMKRFSKNWEILPTQKASRIKYILKIKGAMRLDPYHWNWIPFNPGSRDVNDDFGWEQLFIQPDLSLWLNATSDKTSSHLLFPSKSPSKRFAVWGIIIQCQRQSDPYFRRGLWPSTKNPISPQPSHMVEVYEPTSIAILHFR